MESHCFSIAECGQLDALYWQLDDPSDCNPFGAAITQLLPVKFAINKKS